MFVVPLSLALFSLCPVFSVFVRRLIGRTSLRVGLPIRTIERPGHLGRRQVSVPSYNSLPEILFVSPLSQFPPFPSIFSEQARLYRKQSAENYIIGFVCIL